MAAQQYAIKVFGQSFQVTSEKSEDDVRIVAAYVDRKMRERARESKTIMPLRVAIMTALGIAEELFEKNGEGLRPRNCQDGAREL
jgi:cell division protein ZapA (FtsZ GTPase activity inhibitor)